MPITCSPTKINMKQLHNLLVVSLFYTFLLGITTFKATAQNEDSHQMMVMLTDEPITIDGHLNEAVWQTAPNATDFILNFPNDTEKANSATKVWVTYDEKNLYIAAVMEHPEGNYVISSLRRDEAFENNDSFIVNLDPFNDKLNGFFFGVKPHGVQTEGLISNGGNEDNTWDNVWYSATSRHAGKWIAEMSIPFKSLRFTEGQTVWRINFSRSDQIRNQYSTWAPVPINFDRLSMAFYGKLTFEKPLKSHGANIVLIPYAAGQVGKHHLNKEPLKKDYNLGGDAKITLTPSLNLDLTLNPDFSQVEVDQQVTDLQRFEIFFPERRQFFVENSDLFSRFGFSRIRPFFSRRIGIARDTTTGIIKQNPIQYGARLSGKIGQKWRLGLLNMQTDEDANAGIFSQNYTVMAVQKQVFGRSNIGGIMVHRNGDLPELGRNSTTIAGLDYNLETNNNRWAGKFFFHKAFYDHSPESTQPTTPQNKAYAHASFLRYEDRNWFIMWNHEYVGADYEINDIGFLLRNGLWRLEPSVRFTWYPETKAVFSNSVQGYLNLYTDEDFNLTDRNFFLLFQSTFQNRSQAGVQLNYDWEKIVGQGFIPTSTGELAVGTDYTYKSASFFYSSNPRKLLTFDLSAKAGEFYNGKRLNTSGTAEYRIQPYGSIGLSLDYNRISMPTGFADAEYLLAGTKLSFSFSKSLFLTSFLQYNQQSKNINHNTRLQWRFKPVSDLFLVYSDNYFPSDLQVKSRSLVVKLTYWLNL